MWLPLQNISQLPGRANHWVVGLKPTLWLQKMVSHSFVNLTAGEILPRGGLVLSVHSLDTFGGRISVSVCWFYRRLQLTCVDGYYVRGCRQPIPPQSISSSDPSDISIYHASAHQRSSAQHKNDHYERVCIKGYENIQLRCSVLQSEDCSSFSNAIQDFYGLTILFSKPSLAHSGFLLNSTQPRDNLMVPPIVPTLRLLDGRLISQS